MQTTPYLDVSLSKCYHLGEEFLYMKILQLKPLVGPLQTEEGGYVQCTSKRRVCTSKMKHSSIQRVVLPGV